MIVAHLTGGFTGEVEALLDRVIRPIKNAFFCRSTGMYLISAQFPAEPMYTDPVSGETFGYIRDPGVQLQSFTGVRVFAPLAEGTPLVGGEFTLLVPLEEDVGGVVNDLPS